MTIFLFQCFSKFYYGKFRQGAWMSMFFFLNGKNNTTNISFVKPTNLPYKSTWVVGRSPWWRESWWAPATAFDQRSHFREAQKACGFFQKCSLLAYIYIFFTFRNQEFVIHPLFSTNFWYRLHFLYSKNFYSKSILKISFIY